MKSKLFISIVLIIIFSWFVFSLLGKSEYEFTKDYAPFLDTSTTKQINITKGNWKWDDINWPDVREMEISIVSANKIAVFSKILSECERISDKVERGTDYLTFEVVKKNGSTINFGITKDYEKNVFIEYDGRYYKGDSLISYIHHLAQTASN